MYCKLISGLSLKYCKLLSGRNSIKLTIFLSIFIISFSSFSKTWKVGITKTFKMPSTVSTLVGDGDTVEIDSGLYIKDVAKWTANNLLIKGINGRARLDAQYTSYGSKAIWVIGGKNTRIENIEFYNCKVPDHNGAGIRLEGSNLKLINCYFHHNEMGLLAGDIANCKIDIERSEFAYNGYGDGYSHNIYVNHIDTFIFKYNYSHDADVGHEVKSRAFNNFIMYNRISSEKGNDSRNIDLPNGGKAFLIGNIIEQGSNSQNSNIIGYGFEGLTNPVNHKVYAINNTIVNNRASGSFFSFQNGTEFFKAFNNIIAGNGTFILGDVPLSLDTTANLINKTIADFKFENAKDFNFSLTNQSTNVINNGINAGFAENFSLQAINVYVHPISFKARCTDTKIDIGAYEFCSNAEIHLPKFEISLQPNPAYDRIFINGCNNGEFEIYNSCGKIISKGKFEKFIDTHNLANGLYFISISSNNSIVLKKLIKN
ncbi:MAG: T9SS type A sorting domain-containing protein [Bacteroidetes bacterium]|nr:T9SS type A sorting domain-containing protein [Bacteroidota bacterium]